jgi:HIRAN domain-containing protein
MSAVRHVFLVGLCVAALLFCVPAPVRAGDAAEILVQVSLTAGLRYHEAKAIWDEMQVGDRLLLVREPDNPYDARAVRVEWNGHKLGYIPRTENQALARQIDRGNPLQARITKLTYYRNHRRKLELEVFVPL